MSEETDLRYKISGSALAFLYYECSKSMEDQVGFLLGEKHSVITKAISDADVDGEKIETLIDIKAVLPIGSPFVFCNNIGRIDRKKLKEQLGPFEKDTYGWYIFRRNSKLGPLLRGTLIHEELLGALPHISSQSFVLCCIGSEVTDISTHRHRHVFLSHKNGTFQPISVPVTNLGQPTESVYKSVSIGNVSNSSFNYIISSLDLGRNVKSVDLLKAVQKPLQEKLLCLAKQVQQTDLKAQHTLNNIKSLKAKRLLTEEVNNHGENSVRVISHPKKIVNNGDCDTDSKEKNTELTPTKEKLTLQESRLNSQMSLSEEEMSPMSLKSQMSDRIIEDSSSVEY